jgi:putative transposase
MDFLSVDTIFGKRFSVFFILCIKTRRIVQFGVTDTPDRSFVRNQLFSFVEERDGEKIHLVHDRSGEFMEQDYESLGITSVPTSSFAPNMNAFAERFIGSLRREALNWLVIFNYGQLYRIVQEYIRYYNSLRPHQGIDQNVPQGYSPQTNGDIVSMPVLDGLVRHYFRKVA